MAAWDVDDYYPPNAEMVATCAECPKLRQRIEELEDALCAKHIIEDQGRDRVVVELRAKIKELEAVLAHDLPYPLRSVLTRLRGAAEHLLHDHNCDRHGYEEIGAVIDAVYPIIQRIDAMKGCK
jgi:hypothetical protein